MAEISFSLSTLFEQAFGYKTQAFKPKFADSNESNPFKRTAQGTNGAPYYAKDALGTEYFMPVKLSYSESSPGASTTDSKVANESPSILKDWNMPYPVISISGRKTIVETILTERSGTVKEIINTRDYDIIVKGFIIGVNNEFPEREMSTLRTIYEQNVPISIQSALTDIFLLRPGRTGSDQVVITDLKLPVLPGIKNVRPYELHMVSDEPFNLISIS